MPFQCTCEYCGGTFKHSKARRFCSISCSASFRYARPSAMANTDGVVRFPLTKGKYAFIDAEDAERVLAFRWCVNGDYVSRTRLASEDRERRRIYLHHFIMGEYEGMVIDHIDGDPLNNRRGNLLVATYEQNNNNRKPLGQGREPWKSPHHFIVPVNIGCHDSGTYERVLNQPHLPSIHQPPPKARRYECAQCGAVFSARWGRRPSLSGSPRFCSQACYADYRWPYREPIVNADGSISIPLSRGKVAIIDAIDADERILAFKWSFSGQYATRGRKKKADGYGPTVVFLHQVVMNAPDGALIDHINGDKLDCRRSNLRPATRPQNAWNSRHAVGKSGFRGVKVKGNRWQAQMSVDGRNRYIGSFATPEDAARAYDAEARRLRGEFAVLNFPNDAEVA